MRLSLVTLLLAAGAAPYMVLGQGGGELGREEDERLQALRESERERGAAAAAAAAVAEKNARRGRGSGKKKKLLRDRTRSFLSLSRSLAYFSRDWKL